MNSLQEFNNRLDQAEEKMSKLKDMPLEIIQAEEKEMKKTEGNLRDLWDTSRDQYTQLWEFQKEKRERKDWEALKEIMAKNFPIWGKELDI